MSSTSSSKTSYSSWNVPLTLLPLRPSTRSKLTQRGYVTTADLEDVRQRGGIATIAAELDVTLTEAANLLREVQGCLQLRHNATIQRIHGTSSSSSSSSSTPTSHPDSTTTSLPLTTSLQKEYSIPTACDLLLQLHEYRSQPGQQCRHIVTFCRSIDQLLGGGISLGQVTEIAGMPGVGKTQLAMQLAVDAALPPAFGGVHGQTLYIDSEGSFAPERCWTMAKALVNHVKASAARKRHTSLLPPTFTPTSILESIHVYRVHDEGAQTATLYSLPHVLAQNRKQQQQQGEQHQQELPIRLIVIDSIAFHYRCASGTSHDYVQRTKALTNLATLLGDLARTYHVAIVAINHMTTKVTLNGIRRLVPALGEAWAHAMTTRIRLEQQQQNHIPTSPQPSSPLSPSVHLHRSRYGQDKTCQSC